MLYIDEAVCVYAVQTHGPQAKQWLDAQIAAAIAAAAQPPTLVIVRLTDAGTVIIDRY